MKKLLTPSIKINVASLNNNLEPIYTQVDESLKKLKFTRLNTIKKFPYAVLYRYGHPMLNWFNPITPFTPKGFNYFFVIEQTGDNELTFSIHNHSRSVDPETLNLQYDELFQQLTKAARDIEFSPWTDAAFYDRKFLTNPITFEMSYGFFRTV